LIVKRGKDNSYLFATTDLVTTTPEPNTTITLYNYQRQPITTAKTDATGMAIIKPKSHAEFAIAQKGNNYAYLRLADGNALSMSKFDISGTTLQRGLKGMLYTERGVHRPGDSIHLTFVPSPLMGKVGRRSLVGRGSGQKLKTGFITFQLQQQTHHLQEITMLRLR